MVDVEVRNAVIAMVGYLLSAFKLPARPRRPADPPGAAAAAEQLPAGGERTPRSTASILHITALGHISADDASEVFPPFCIARVHILVGLGMKVGEDVHEGVSQLVTGTTMGAGTCPNVGPGTHGRQLVGDR
jgi:hypothetical protein